jgi:biopolymer transport protein ExbD
MALPRWRKKRFKDEGVYGFPVIPMIDVMLNLLIFFMLISRYLPPALSVTLPEASNAIPEDRMAISLAIDSEGALVVDGQPANWEELPGLLNGKDPETQVRIGADRTVDYDYVVKAMDAAASAGLVHVALEASQPDTPLPQP